LVCPLQPFDPDLEEKFSHQCAIEGDGEPEPATSVLIDWVTKATWQESQLGGLPSNPLPLWTMLASRVLLAVVKGERDPQRLKRSL
jgi:hypothetical protein